MKTAPPLKTFCVSLPLIAVLASCGGSSNDNPSPAVEADVSITSTNTPVILDAIDRIFEARKNIFAVVNTRVNKVASSDSFQSKLRLLPLITPLHNNHIPTASKNA